MGTSHITLDRERDGNKPEISPEIYDLPRTQRNKHAHRPNRKPLHALIRAFIGVPQLLLPRSQVLHLRHDLVDRLFHPSQLGLDGLQLLGGLYRGPVLGVGADVNIELDVA